MGWYRRVYMGDIVSDMTVNDCLQTEVIRHLRSFSPNTETNGDIKVMDRVSSTCI